MGTWTRFIVKLFLDYFAYYSTTTTDPTVTLDNATFTGLNSGSVVQFLGIPFAQPPIGDLRFRSPEPIEFYTGHHLATTFGPACVQQTVRLPAFPPQVPKEGIDGMRRVVYVFPESEDCLTMNVIVPQNRSSGDEKLPVVVWIHGGGWQTGAASSYDGQPIVDRSIELGKPIIYVSMQYRLNGFGFLAGKQVKEAGIGNLGLQDQRLALRWIQKHISAFGGDPTKVTLWGESAGAISISLHMVAAAPDPQQETSTTTTNLYRAAFMQSGSPLSLGDLTNGQHFYDDMVIETGCSGEDDTLACLRRVPYERIKAAIDRSPGFMDYDGLRLSWPPRVDGKFITDNPYKLVQQGNVADIPFVTGTCDDEGTFFSFGNSNLTTESQFRDYVQTVLWQGMSDENTARLATLYIQNVTQGSPFDTGLSNAYTPQFKRLSALLGDIIFQAPRRYFQQHRSGKQAMWTFLSKRFKTQPLLGAAHTSDLANTFGGGELVDYLINFVVHLDPNGPGQVHWPKYTTSNPHSLTFLDGDLPITVTRDTFRQEGMAFVMDMSLAHPL